MTINLTMPRTTSELKPRIAVFGVGGAGGNAVNNMIKSELEGVEFIVANTDAQALTQSLSERKIQLGVGVTQGLGAGSRPDIGRAAAEETMDTILEHMNGCHMVFITAGMGGGTGTGAAPVIARAAREQGILTVGVVTKPFHFEGIKRMRVAESGIEDLQQYVDTLIIIPNQNLFRVANEKTTFADAFKMADDVLHSGVRGVTDLMVMPGLINLDFADIRAIMTEMGKAQMGTGEAEGDKRAINAAEAAISNPLLDDVSMKGARGVLINITGGSDMTLFEVDEAANRIREEVDPEANIIFGSTCDKELEGRIRVSVVATGIDANAATSPQPQPITLFAEYRRQQPQPQPQPQTAQRIHATVAAPTPATVVRNAPVIGRAQAVAVAVAAPEPMAQPELILAHEVPEAVADSAPAPVESRAEPAPAKDAPFVPPRAVEPSLSREPARSPEPFAAAAMANGAGESGRVTRGPSLMDRVANAGWSRRPVEARPHAEPSLAEPKLSGLERTESVSAPSDADILDIPAFLRRQAN
jgi:cell division protein FtsZ